MDFNDLDRVPMHALRNHLEKRERERVTHASARSPLSSDGRLFVACSNDNTIHVTFPRLVIYGIWQIASVC